MNIARKRERDAAVTEDVGEGFRVKAAADTVGRKGVTEPMVVVFRHFSGGEYFLVTILHCARLDNFFRSAENVTVRSEHIKIRHKTIGDRNNATRGLAFRRGNNDFCFSVPLSSGNALNGAVYPQSLVLKVNVVPPQTTQLAYSNAHKQRDQNAERCKIDMLF